MSLETRNIMDGSELREGIGLQYFAGDGNSSETGADMDGFDGDAFLESLTGENGLENQQAAAPDGGAEGEEGGLENPQFFKSGFLSTTRNVLNSERNVVFRLQ